jgi:hypothetical protein
VHDVEAHAPQLRVLQGFWDRPREAAGDSVRRSLRQRGTSSFAFNPWGRSHSDACSGCIVSLTTPSTSPLKESRSVSSRNLELKAASVLVASYFLL